MLYTWYILEMCTYKLCQPCNNVVYMYVYDTVHTDVKALCAINIRLFVLCMYCQSVMYNYQRYVS